MISIVVPVYNEESNVEELHKRAREELAKLGESYEIIFIDDGSSDHTYERLKMLHPIKIIRLQKNFGQTAAMDAGFHAAQGDVVITMDGDLQNDPSDIGKLTEQLKKGFDVVSGWRTERQDLLGRKILSRLANWLTFKVTGLYLHDHACAMKAYRRELLKDVHLYGEMHVFLPAYLYGRGAKVTEIPVTHHARHEGLSKHNFMKAVKDISDLLTVKFLSQYMSRPLLLFGGCSLALFGLGSITVLTAILLRTLGRGKDFTLFLLIAAVLFFIIGFLLFMLGFLAELMVRIYCESQNRTPYIIKDVVENK